MVGAGVFSLPRRFAQETGVAGALIAWAIAGTGMLMLAFVFQTLAVRKPDLDAGVYAYAKAGFGEYLGFFSAFGYWASACVGNVTYWVLIMSTVGAIAPALGDGDTVLAHRAVDGRHLGVLPPDPARREGGRGRSTGSSPSPRSCRSSSSSLLALFCLDPQVFADNCERRRRRRDRCSTRSRARCWSRSSCSSASRARASTPGTPSAARTSAGRRPRASSASSRLRLGHDRVVRHPADDEIAELRQPSMAGVLEAAVGEWGKVFVSVGLIVSVLGAYLAWTLMAAEVLFVAAKDDDMPRFLGASNARRRARRPRC